MIQNELLQIIADLIRERITNDVRASGWYGIILDETSDIMHRSIPAVPIPPPRATAGHLLTLSVPGAGHKRSPGRPPGI